MDWLEKRQALESVYSPLAKLRYSQHFGDSNSCAMNQGVNIPISLSNSDDFDDIVDDSDEQFDASTLVLDSAVDNTDKEVPMPMC